MSEPTTATAVKARLALAERSLPLAQQLATQLAGMGFQVAQVSGRGVAFAGPAALFERVFQSGVHPAAGGFAFTGPPRLPSTLAAAGASVYLPTRPEFFP